MLSHPWSTAAKGTIAGLSIGIRWLAHFHTPLSDGCNSCTIVCSMCYNVLQVITNISSGKTCRGQWFNIWFTEYIVSKLLLVIWTRDFNENYFVLANKLGCFHDTLWQPTFAYRDSFLVQHTKCLNKAVKVCWALDVYSVKPNECRSNQYIHFCALLCFKISHCDQALNGQFISIRLWASKGPQLIVSQLPSFKVGCQVMKCAWDSRLLCKLNSHEQWSHTTSWIVWLNKRKLALANTQS